VGLLQEIENRILSPILAAVKKWLGPFGHVFDKIKDSITHLLRIRETVQTLADSVKEEITGWSKFRQNLRVKSRVINIPKAYDKTKELITGFGDAWHAAIDVFKDIQRTLKGAPEPEEFAAEEATAFTEEGGAEGLAKLFPKLAKFGEKALGVVTIFVQALEGIADALDDLQTIVDEAKRIREEIETGESFFLSQSNPRRTEVLQDGSKIRVRLGKLHQ